MVVHAQSCLTLCDPMDCSPPSFSVHGIFQARILEWVAISSSRGFSRLRDGTGVSCISCSLAVDSLSLRYLGKPVSDQHALKYFGRSAEKKNQHFPQGTYEGQQRIEKSKLHLACYGKRMTVTINTEGEPFCS